MLVRMWTRAYDFKALTPDFVTATNYAITNVYNPTQIYMYQDVDDQTGYFDGNYGTSGGAWAWNACSSGATYYGSNAAHTRDCVWDEVHYNLDYVSQFSTLTRKKALACHETGHLWGLLHNTSTSTCMHNTPGTATTITSGEKGLINDHY